MKEIDPGEPELIDAGHLGDSDKINRVVCGEVKPGTLEVETIYKKADFTAISALWRSETVNWQVTFPEASSPLTRTFAGILTKIPTGPFERKGLVMMKLTIQINGPIT